jgi:hypothetical protein
MYGTDAVGGALHNNDISVSEQGGRHDSWGLLATLACSAIHVLLAVPSRPVRRIVLQRVVNGWRGWWCFSPPKDGRPQQASDSSQLMASA